MDMSTYTLVKLIDELSELFENNIEEERRLRGGIVDVVQSNPECEQGAVAFPLHQRRLRGIARDELILHLVLQWPHAGWNLVERVDEFHVHGCTTIGQVHGFNKACIM